MIKTEGKMKRGFTLVEMMVAVSIFVIVAFIVVSTLLTMSFAYKKAQKMRLLMDNFNFALQSMSLTIREGVDYQPSCASSDNECVKFKPIDSWIGSEDNYICYSLNSDSGSGYIEKCSGNSALACPCSGGTRFTSPDINVDKLSFEINEGSPVFSSGLNKVKILISGEAGVLSREKTSFFIQNTVSQRNNNNL